MGFEMAVNLSKSNYDVSVYDIVQDKYKVLEENNIKCFTSIEKAVKDCDAIISMLPDGQIVKDVWKKVFETLQKKPLAIDCSTIDIESALTFHKLASTNNISSLDAPVSGGVVGAKNGSLTFMVGGKESVYLKAKPIFDIMGSKSILCGSESSGQAVKICNNMLLAVTMVGVSEAFNLAESLNIDSKNLFDVISTSSGSCWAVNNYCPIPEVGPTSPADNDFKPGFASKLMHKDLSLALDAAKRNKVKIDFTNNAFEIFSEMLKNNYGEKDFSYLKKYLQ